MTTANPVPNLGDLVRRFVAVIDGDLAGLELLRELRVALADMYAAGPRLPELPSMCPPEGHVEPVTESKQAALVASVESRLPREMYWSGLLPLTYLTVGDAGVKQFADDLREIYFWLAPGFGRNHATVGDWQSYWGMPTVRCLAVLHEVIGDLEMNLYGCS